MTQWLNLASHSVKVLLEINNVQCSCGHSKARGETWTMKHWLPAGRLPFTRALCGPRPTFLKGQHALAPSRYPLCFHTVNAELSRRTIPWLAHAEDGKIELEESFWWCNDDNHVFFSEKQGKWYYLNRLNYEKWEFNITMEPDLNASMPKWHACCFFPDSRYTKHADYT